MAATTQTVEQVSLKLVVVSEDNKTDKVLYAEAGKDFMDVLCSFLTLPLGTIARLIEKKSDMGPVTLGCLNSFYHRMADLDKECLRTETCKGMLLQPTNSSECYCSALKLNIDDTEPTKYFICSGMHNFSSSYRCFRTSNKKCYCGSLINRVLFLKFKSLNKGFVKDGVSFFITDDLVVMPNSLQFTSFGLLQKCGLKSIGSIKEMNVNVTREKVLDLLKCALFSKSPLTDFFLGKKPSLKRSRIRRFSCDIKNDSNIQFSLKLVIRKSAGKILFAEGEQDFADFLLSFLAFPLGGVERILGGNCSLGSIDELYKSIAGFDENIYLTSSEAKTRLVNPHVAPQFKLIKSILPVQQHVDYNVNLNECIFIGDEFFVSDKTIAGKSKFGATRLPANLNLPKGSEGYFKGPAMYVVTDDLIISPSSLISTLSLMSQIPLDDLMEKVVTIGVKECLNILKAFLTSTSVLTDSLSHSLVNRSQGGENRTFKIVKQVCNQQYF